MKKIDQIYTVYTYSARVNKCSNAQWKTAEQHGKDGVTQKIRRCADQLNRGHANRRLDGDGRLSRIRELRAHYSSILLTLIPRSAGIDSWRRVSSVGVLRLLLVRWRYQPRFLKWIRHSVFSPSVETSVAFLRCSAETTHIGICQRGNKLFIYVLWHFVVMENSMNWAQGRSNKTYSVPCVHYIIY